MVDSAITAKGIRTRAHILETSLDVFRERGFEQTTMRSIAEAAGVSLGNAYYYFPSKESLIQNFYIRTNEEFEALTVPLLKQELEFENRLNGVLRAKIDTLLPYQQFAAVLFRTAGDPESPLHPFSAASSPVRNATISIFEQLVRGSRGRIPSQLATDLPELLWLYHLGIILFWIHDRSPGSQRTYRLIDRSAAFAALLIRLGGIPLSRPLLNRVLSLIGEVKREVIA